MVIDTSALIAILRREQEADSFIAAIQQAPVRLLSAVTKLEAYMVAAGSRERGGNDLDDLLQELNVEVVAFSVDHANVASAAFLRFGKGRQRAGLNFGDCAAYALAVLEAEPLLFKGADFTKTDVEAVFPAHD